MRLIGKITSTAAGIARSRGLALPGNAGHLKRTFATTKVSPAEISKLLQSRISGWDTQKDVKDVGHVINVGDGIARIYGLKEVKAGELVMFSSGVAGMALNLETDNIGVVVFGDDRSILEGDSVSRTNRILDVPVGPELLGRVVDALGRPIDGKGELVTKQRSRVEVPAPGIIDRRSVHEPMTTGMKCVDSLVPIGRGQRELIIGDRQTGKTALAGNAPHTLSRHDPKPEGQQRKQRRVEEALLHLRGNRAEAIDGREDPQDARGPRRTQVLDRRGSDGVGPRTAAVPGALHGMGEWFRNNKKHCVIIYDDLSKQATAYRQMSLLLRRPPGREAYPGKDPPTRRRHLLPALAAARAGSQDERREGRGLAHGAACDRDAGGRRVGVHPDQRDINHRRADLPRERAFLQG